ncbi:MAG: helicase-related protein [Christensenellales bacterium]
MFENIDNKTKLLGDDLKVELKKDSKVRIASSCFSMYAFKELKEELSQIDELRFLFTSPTFTNETLAEGTKKEKREFFIPKQNRENSLYGSEFEIKLRNEMTLKAIAKECAEWVRKKVKFKSNITNSTIPNLIGIQKSDGQSITYNPVNGFTTTDLGYQQGNSIFTAISKTDFAEQSKFLFSMFDEIWNDKSKVADITDNVVEMISSAYQENSPEFIYYIILYNIFSEFLDDISEDNMPNEATGFKDTKIWNMLYDFQKDGVISIINKLEKHNGCILADSVGLGKTFTALAVIAYYSLRNKSILVLCPKRLSDNWTQYCGSSNDTPNIFYEDRIRYEVLYHTDLGRAGTAHNGRDLKLVNWGNYDLVVIDESHNFRNNNPVKDKETRYDFLINHVIKEGVKTKVLMLSATPVNNRYNDLKNQLALAYSQNYEAFEKSLDTKSNVATIFRQAQAVFNDWSKLPPNERKTKDLIDSLSIDFKILLDSVTIARSRKNITKYYNMNSIGKFPDRLPPRSLYPELTQRKDVLTYKEIYQHIKSMSMSVYGLFDFILDSQKSKYERRYDVEFKASNFGSNMEKGRQSGIKRLMTVNLLKRLESSVESFRLTMRGMLDLNKSELRRLDYFENGQLRPDATTSKKMFNYEVFDQDEDGSLNLVQTDKGKDVAIEYADIDRVSWRNAMQEDVRILEHLLSELEKVTPEYDLKLQTLKDIIDDKIKNPINDGNKKVVIFSAFADTANYLYDNLHKWLKDNYGIETAMIEGGQNKVTLKHCPKKTNTLLTMFSPISKNRDKVFSWIPKQIESYNDPKLNWSGKIDKHEFDDCFKDIDVLIATDCISEGQNLQDCDMCINYDIHWNPVRIVQRFGRIDRIGSINKVIQLVNFWPPLPLNEYINLTDRVKSRMTIVDQTATADDNLLSPDDQIDDYREVQIKKLREGENIDLEDTSNGISISDLGLNEFRMDATEFVKTYGEPKRVPKGLHCVIEKDESKGIVPGVIYILRNHNDNVNINRQNRLHPYYLVYVGENGEIVNNHLEVKEVLDAIRISCKGKTEPVYNACSKFNEETNDGLDMSKYSKLLEKSIESIIQVKEQGDLNALFKQGSMVLDGVKIKGLDDFELIAFVVVK